jgi:hypothetical protein
MKKRVNKIQELYKAALEESDSSDKEISFAKKLMSMPKDIIVKIICIILNDDESIKDDVYNKVFKKEQKLEDLA